MAWRSQTDPPRRVKLTRMAATIKPRAEAGPRAELIRDPMRHRLRRARTKASETTAAPTIRVVPTRASPRAAAPKEAPRDVRRGDQHPGKVRSAIAIRKAQQWQQQMQFQQMQQPMSYPTLEVMLHRRPKPNLGGSTPARKVQPKKKQHACGSATRDSNKSDEDEYDSSYGEDEEEESRPTNDPVVEPSDRSASALGQPRQK